MSNSSSTGRLHCPACSARLAVPPGNKSPYIRCGVCNTLFETEVEPSEISEHRQPYPAKSDDEILTISDSVEPTSITRPARPNHPEMDWTQSRQPVMGMRWTTGSVAIVAIIFFGFVIFSLLSWADSSHPRTRTRGYSYRSSSHPIAVPKQSVRAIDREFKRWNSTSSDFPKFELDLNALELSGKKDSAFLANPDVDSIKLDGRNFTNVEISRISRLKKLRKLQYRNVTIQNRDLRILNSQQLFELDLSHSKWNPGQLYFGSKSFPYLTKLNLSYSNVQKFSLINICNCPKLTHLNLRGTDIDNESLSLLATHQTLEELDLCETKVNFVSLKRLRIPNLKLLKVTAGVLTTEQREKISQHHRGARILVLNSPD